MGHQAEFGLRGEPWESELQRAMPPGPTDPLNINIDVGGRSRSRIKRSAPEFPGHTQARRCTAHVLKFRQDWGATRLCATSRPEWGLRRRSLAAPALSVRVCSVEPFQVVLRSAMCISSAECCDALLRDWPSEVLRSDREFTTCGRYPCSGASGRTSVSVPVCVGRTSMGIDNARTSWGPGVAERAPSRRAMPTEPMFVQIRDARPCSACCSCGVGPCPARRWPLYLGT